MNETQATLSAAQAIDKVRKLLALANSANEHEAANAANRAAQIMERYRLDAAMLADAEQAEAEQAEEAFSTNEDQPAEREYGAMPSWYWMLAWAVAGANRCRPVVTYSSDKRRVVFYGRPSDAAASAYMLDAVANAVDDLARAAVRGRVRPRAYGKAFRLGAARTISERLRTAADEAATKRRAELSAARDDAGLDRLDRAIALRQTDGERLDAFLRERGIRYTSARTITCSSRDGYAAGREAGRGVHLGGGRALGTGPRAIGGGR